MSFNLIRLWQRNHLDIKRTSLVTTGWRKTDMFYTYNPTRRSCIYIYVTKTVYFDPLRNGTAVLDVRKALFFLNLINIMLDTREHNLI